MGENEARTLLLEAIEGSLQQPEPPQHTNELNGDVRQTVLAMGTWRSHELDRFFLGMSLLFSASCTSTETRSRIWSTQSPTFLSAPRSAPVRFLTQRARVALARVSRFWTQCCPHAPPDNQLPVGSQHKEKSINYKL